MFVSMTTPRTDTLALYAILFMGTFAVSGMAYLVSVLVNPRDAQLAIVVLVLVTSMFGGISPPLAELRKMGPVGVGMASLSYGRYMNDAMLSANVARWPNVFCTEIIGQLTLLGFELDSFHFCLTSLLALGVAFRLVACVVLFYDGRSAVRELRAAI